jgi:hypothetical protein
MAEETREIPLTKGYVALVSEGDYERVNAFKWRALVGTHNIYAVRSVRDKANRYTVLMHRFITDASPGLQIDHIDGDGLNNTRSNLRLATHAQNGQNSRKQVNNTSGYIGVSREGKSKWRAQIRVDGSKTYLGSFETAEEAAEARDRAARKLHGEFAVLNFPEESHD